MPTSSKRRTDVAAGYIAYSYLHSHVAKPEQSDRQVAKQTKTSPTTVSARASSEVSVEEHTAEHVALDRAGAS